MKNSNKMNWVNFLDLIVTQSISTATVNKVHGINTSIRTISLL